jgi:hypothetical protein
MISNRRRITIIVISVLTGSILSVLLIMSRQQKLSSAEWSTLAINFFFALAIVFAIGFFLSKKSK